MFEIYLNFYLQNFLHPLQLLGSGTILREIIAAAEILEKDYKIDSDVWSVTSYNELRNQPSYLIMIFIACFLLYLGIVKKYEPLLLNILTVRCN